MTALLKVPKEVTFIGYHNINNSVVKRYEKAIFDFIEFEVKNVQNKMASFFLFGEYISRNL